MQRFPCLLGVFICCGVILLVNPNMAAADGETTEEQIFSGADTVVGQEQLVKDNVDDELKENHVGFSGQISANMVSYSFNPAYDTTGYIQDSSILYNLMSADLFMDARLKQGVKGFLSVGIDYYPALNSETATFLGLDSNADVSSAATTADYTDITIKELFVDTNLQNQVYFRLGKQVLQWGQGYLWNPSDLLNVEKKSFADMDNVRQGTYGIKTQIPFGVKQNLYFFTDMNDATDASGVAQAAKYEFLIGDTEMSLSVLAKEGNKPIFGWDFTSRVGDVDLRGEMSLTNGSDCSRIDDDDITKTVDFGDQMISRVCLGFTKGFDQGNIKDRINLTGEFYYNQAGYDRNIIRRIAESGDAGALQSMASQYLADPYSLSQYYMALFSSVSKFIVPALTFNLNGITNLVDHSATLITGITYAPELNNITIDLNVGYNLGDKYTETMLLGERSYINLKMTIKF